MNGASQHRFKVSFLENMGWTFAVMVTFYEFGTKITLQTHIRKFEILEISLWHSFRTIFKEKQDWKDFQS